MDAKARIIVTLVCEYEGDDVAEYDAAMNAARDEVESAADELVSYSRNVRVLEVTASG